MTENTMPPFMDSLYSTRREPEIHMTGFDIFDYIRDEDYIVDPDNLPAKPSSSQADEPLFFGPLSFLVQSLIDKGTWNARWERFLVDKMSERPGELDQPMKIEEAGELQREKDDLVSSSFHSTSPSAPKNVDRLSILSDLDDLVAFSTPEKIVSVELFEKAVLTSVSQEEVTAPADTTMTGISVDASPGDLTNQAVASGPLLASRGANTLHESVSRNKLVEAKSRLEAENKPDRGKKKKLDEQKKTNLVEETRAKLDEETKTTLDPEALRALEMEWMISFGEQLLSGLESKPDAGKSDMGKEEKQNKGDDEKKTTLDTTAVMATEVEGMTLVGEWLRCELEKKKAKVDLV
ncbi:hypothetical protein C8J56DRAFT_586018 [Mycena floridula]|nr:hypothetical protein C8J56DRAFT_586018 [Mycena floridula]